MSKRETVSGRERLAPYRTREVRFLGLETIEGHRLKLYALEARGRTVRGETVDAARPKVAAALAERMESAHEHRFGFVVLHAGEEALWLLVDRWINGDALCQKLYSAPSEGPLVFQDRSGGDFLFCVWEGAVVDHERQAFIRHMMVDEPDAERYLADTLNGPV